MTSPQNREAELRKEWLKKFQETQLPSDEFDVGKDYDREEVRTATEIADYWLSILAKEREEVKQNIKIKASLIAGTFIGNDTKVVALDDIIRIINEA